MNANIGVEEEQEFAFCCAGADITSLRGSTSGACRQNACPMLCSDSGRAISRTVVDNDAFEWL